MVGGEAVYLADKFIDIHVVGAFFYLALAPAGYLGISPRDFALPRSLQQDAVQLVSRFRRAAAVLLFFTHNVAY